MIFLAVSVPVNTFYSEVVMLVSAWFPRKQIWDKAFCARIYWETFWGAGMRGRGEQSRQEDLMELATAKCNWVLDPKPPEEPYEDLPWFGQLLWCCLPTSDFLFLSFLLHFGNWNSSVKNCPVSSLFTPIQTHGSFPCGLQSIPMIICCSNHLRFSHWELS